jgi:hypothetical protein
MHQDIAPRNLLIDSYTQKIVLFDFDRAVFGNKQLYDDRDDVTSVVFTLYELITNDQSFSDIPDSFRNLILKSRYGARYLRMDWESRARLRGVKIPQISNEWVITRRSDGDIERYFNTPHRFAWPDLPAAPDYSIPFEMGTTWDGKPSWVTGHRSRCTAMKMGQCYFHWERPPQCQSLIEVGHGAMYLIVDS